MVLWDKSRSRLKFIAFQPQKLKIYFLPHSLASYPALFSPDPNPTLTPHCHPALPNSFQMLVKSAHELTLSRLNPSPKSFLMLVMQRHSITLSSFPVSGNCPGENQSQILPFPRFQPNCLAITSFFLLSCPFSPSPSQEPLFPSAGVAAMQSHKLSALQNLKSGNTGEIGINCLP